MRASNRWVLGALGALLVGLFLLTPTGLRSEDPTQSATFSSGAIVAQVSLPPSAIRVPLCRQATDYTCGVAALQSILGYHLTDVRQDVLAKKVKADPQTGARYRQIEKYARKQGYTVTDYADMTIEDLETLLDAGNPVICLIQAWAKPGTDYANDWKDGHYVVAIGYDQNSVYFMDPSTLGNYTYIPIDEFLVRWHDGDSKRKYVHFGICLQKAGPLYNPEEVLPLG